MRRKLLPLLAFMTIVLGANSCGMLLSIGVSGSISGSRSYLDGTKNQNDTKVLLQEGNFKVVGIVEGHASAIYIFGIGGLGEPAVKGNAIADMYKNANLHGSQAIINVSFTRHDKTILVYNEVLWTCQGLVIEFTAPLKNKKCKNDAAVPATAPVAAPVVPEIIIPAYVEFTNLDEMVSDDLFAAFKKATQDNQTEFLKAAVAKAVNAFPNIKSLKDLRDFERNLDFIEKYYNSTDLDLISLDSDIRTLRRKVAYVRSSL